MTTGEQTTVRGGWERDWNKRRKWNSKVPTVRCRPLLDESRTGLAVRLALIGGCILSWQPQSHPSHVAEPQSSHTLSWAATSPHQGKDTIPIRFCFLFHLQRPPQARPCWRECECNCNSRWASVDSGEGTDARWHIQACQSDVLKSSCSLFSPLRQSWTLLTVSPPSVSPQWNFSCHFSQEELINIPLKYTNQNGLATLFLRWGKIFLLLFFSVFFAGDFFFFFPLHHY